MKASRGWFADYGAIACAAEKNLHGEPFYSVDLACDGMNNSFFIYHPWVADIFAALLAPLGRGGMLIAYAGVYVLSIAVMVWFMIGRGGARRGANEPGSPRFYPAARSIGAISGLF